MLDVKYTDEEIARINLVLKWTGLNLASEHIYLQYVNDLENLIVNGKLVQIRPSTKHVEIYPVENGCTVPNTFVFTNWRCRYEDPLQMQDIINLYQYWGMLIPPLRDWDEPQITDDNKTKMWRNPHNREKFQLYYSFTSSTLVLDHLHESGKIHSRIVNPPRIGALA